ncbi:C2H2 zinc-finger containing protein [Lotmaria passim]
MLEDDFAKAAALFSAGRYHEAVSAYTAIEAAPDASLADRARALNNISACYAALKDYETSLSMALDVIALQPDNAKALGRAATAHEGLKHYEEAAQFFSRAAAAEATNTDYAAGAQRCTALVQARRGVATSAAKDAYYYKKSLEKGTEAMKASNFMEAIRHFGKALDLFPATATSREKAALLCNRSAAYFRAARLAESADDALMATQADDTYARAFFRLGAARAKLKKTVEAYDALTTCVQLDPEHSEARQLLAEVTPAALEARKTTEERAREYTDRVVDLAAKMSEEQAAKAATMLPPVSVARSASYSYCSYCNETGHSRAECPLLRRKRSRPL